MNSEKNIVLIGAGIMSATLGVLLKKLMPQCNIHIYERLDKTAAESSDAWNNAGTGHSAFCELNYTPQNSDGEIDITKALKIANSFEHSKEFWASLVEINCLKNPKTFINSIPHMSFVWGADNVWYLRKRHEALTKHHFFEDMQYSEKWNDLEQWMPLIMEGRDFGIEVAATKMNIGTDVNFGALTRQLLSYLQTLQGVTLHLNHEVRDIEKTDDDKWNLTIKNLTTHDKFEQNFDFVFIGAGGGSLPLLEKSNIKEAEGYGGFPVSGQWLKCKNEAVIAQHHAKVYGKASVGSPPMSVPHLDTRMINGKKELLFGPYAGFSTKFLKNGSYWDLVGSLELDNLFPMLSVGAHNMPLTKYLIQQATQTPEDRLEALQAYFPEAKIEDWELEIAGQRVQVIKKDEEEGGVLEFGTEIVTSEDGSIAALLGASPGASVSVSVMLDVLKKCFKTEMNTDDWKQKIQTLIPSYGLSLKENRELCFNSRARTHAVLKIE